MQSLEARKALACRLAEDGITNLVVDVMQRRLLEARKVFRANLHKKRDGRSVLQSRRYNAAASVQGNILFGKIAYGEADAPGPDPKVLGE